MRCPSPNVLPGLLLLAVLSPASAAAESPIALFGAARTGSAGATGLAGGQAPVMVRLDRAAADRLRSLGRARVALPLPDGGVTLDLRPLAILAPDARVTAAGAAGSRPLGVDVTVLGGEVEGEPGSIVTLALSDRGVQGTVLRRDRRYTIAPERSGATEHGVAFEAARPGDAAPYRCGTDDLPRLPEGAVRAPRARAEAPQSPFPSPTRYVCTCMVDCDYEYYNDKFGGDSVAAVAYLLTVYGTVSQIYERDLNISLQIVHLTLWTTPGDPWGPGDFQEQLTLYSGWCNNNRMGVSRHLAQLVRGYAFGGGVAWLHGLCSNSRGYAVFQWDATYAYPTSATTWDVMVTAHELGHNYGSEHTHSCYWQTNGFVPSGALLDSCYTAEGICYSGPTGIVPSVKGTIMSYCHTFGMSNIRTEFHAACRTVMREEAELSCIPFNPATVQPPRQLVATSHPGGNALNWLPSPSSGVLRYRIYRATLPFDNNPVPIDSTLSTIYVDPTPGAWYYKVRAVRAADESGWSNEVRAAACAPANPSVHAVGAGPVALLSGRFNADQVTDLAAVNGDGASVSILLGQRVTPSHSPFSSALPVAVGTHPTSIAAADFDRDGALDLAVGIGDSNAVTILRGLTSLGIPTGSFAPAGTWPAGTSPRAVLALDVDEDGITDLVAACGNGQVARLRGLGTPGTGDGTFAAPATFPAAAQPALGLAAGDFDADGILDLAVTDSAGVVVLRGLGSAGDGSGDFGTATAYPAGAGARGITTGDFDEDGALDLAVACAAANAVAILRGNGDGTFAAASLKLVAGGPTSVVAGDWNQDGLTDLATSNSSGTTIGLLFGQGAGGIGDGTFTAASYGSVGATPRAILGLEWNDDGRPDLAVLNGTASGSVNVLSMGCAGPYAGAIDVTSPSGGELWIAPSEHAITWAQDAAVPEVNIDLSRDGGASWQTIASHLTGTSWIWTVAEPYTTEGRIRVYDPTVPARVDTSAGTFTVLPQSALGVGSGSAARLAIHRVEPTPSRGELTVWLLLPHPGRASLELLDVAGRRVRALELEAPGPGPHTVALTRGRGLASGIYLVRLTQAGRAASARAVVIR